jgi:hypothetical protein
MLISYVEAYRSPGEYRFSSEFSEASTKIASEGHAAAHNEQPIHFSKPLS